MYKIVSALNRFIRGEMMPNPFEYIFENQITAILIFSLFGGKILNDIAYKMCGVFYKSKRNKTLGSIGYMFFYYINVQALIKLCQCFQDINLVISIYIIFVIVMFIISNKLKSVIRQNIITS